MKLPIGIIARFALKRIVLPAIGKAVASKDNPLTTNSARDAVVKALQDEAFRQIAKQSL